MSKYCPDCGFQNEDEDLYCEECGTKIAENLQFERDNLIKISCRSCFAKLELTEDIDRFNCAHCGDEWIVNRSGGIVSLKLVEDSITSLKVLKDYDSFFDAVKRDDVAKVEEYINHGANVNTKNKWGRTPLHWAAYNGHTATAELLIQKGADVNAKDNDGRTPLHLAALNGHTATAELLIQKGADVNAKNKDSWTPPGPSDEPTIIPFD